MSTENHKFTSILEGYLNTAIDGIITLNERGVIQLVNNSVADMFGYKNHELIGQKINILMPEPDSSRHDKYMNNYKRTNIKKIIGIGREVHGKKKDGTIFPIRIAVSEVLIEGQTIYTGVIHDQTELNHVNAKLTKINNELENLVEQRTNELETAVNHLLEVNKKLEENEKSLALALNKEKELNELKTRFVSMASHEFRTPLSTIMSSASIIAKYTKEEDQPKRIKHVERINSTVQNLTAILKDFLTISKLEEGHLNLNISKFNVYELIQEVVLIMENLLKDGQRILFKTNCPNFILESDRHFLENILINLLSNAVKYSDKNSAIELVLANEDDVCTIQVKDHGIGIPLQDKEYLFTRFFRASNSENIQGSGLGLHIVQTYAKELHGSISFESQENKGSTFTLKLPQYNG